MLLAQHFVFFQTMKQLQKRRQISLNLIVNGCQLVKLIQRAQYSSNMFWTSDADKSNSIATSIGFFPFANRNNALVSTDLVLISLISLDPSSSSRPSIFRIIDPISVNDRCAAAAI
jgi:hypothetical protein